MLEKLVTLGLLKKKAMYDVMISAHDATNKSLSFESNYIVDIAMRPKFGGSSISMRAVIMTSILERFDQKIHFFDWRFWFKFNNFFKFNNLRNSILGIALKVYNSVAKRIKT